MYKSAPPGPISRTSKKPYPVDTWSGRPPRMPVTSSRSLAKLFSLTSGLSFKWWLLGKRNECIAALRAVFAIKQPPRQRLFGMEIYVHWVDIDCLKVAWLAPPHSNSLPATAVRFPILIITELIKQKGFPFSMGLLVAQTMYHFVNGFVFITIQQVPISYWYTWQYHVKGLWSFGIGVQSNALGSKYEWLMALAVIGRTFRSAACICLSQADVRKAQHSSRR